MYDKATIEGMKRLLNEIEKDDVLQENEEWVNIIDVDGYSNELLTISNSGEMKMTRLFALLGDLDGTGETLDVSITSTNHYKGFPVFDKLLNKKLRIRVDVQDV